MRIGPQIDDPDLPLVSRVRTWPQTPHLSMRNASERSTPISDPDRPSSLRTWCEQLLHDKFKTTIEASYGTAMSYFRIVARCLAVAVAIVGIQPASASDFQTAPHDSPFGDWRGMSVCQVKPSGCRDEDSLYHFTLAGSEIRIRADKIVDGKAVTIGTSVCVRSAAGQLECRVS